MEGADGTLHFLFFHLLEAIKIIFLAHMHFFLYLRTSALAFVPHATQPRKSQFPRSYSHPTQPILQSLALFFENTATPLIELLPMHSFVSKLPPSA